MVNFKILKSTASIGLLLILDSQRYSNRWLRVKVLLFMILIKFRNAVLKSYFDILTIFGTDFKVRKSMFLLEKLFCFFLGNFSVFQVTFVTKNDKMKVVFWTKICLRQELVSPLDNLIKSLSISKIKNQKTSIAALIKDIQKCSKLFLSRRVPNGI